MGFDLEQANYIVSMVCAIIGAVLGIIAVKKYTAKQVYYGNKAVKEFEGLKLKPDKMHLSYEYEGGNRKIFPQLAIERRSITYYIEEDGKRMVKVWNQ